MLSIEELSELEGAIMEVLPDKLTQILSRTNRTGKLDELLELLGLSYLLGNDNQFKPYKTGKIVVIGESQIKENVLESIGKKYGFDKNRFEFWLDYDALKTPKYRDKLKNMQYSPKYAVILFGPVPHSAHEKGVSRSIITEIEHKPGYPTVRKMESNGQLKITKSNFREMLQKLIDESHIKVG